MTRAPAEIRARHLHTSLDAVEKLPPKDAQAVREALRPGLVEEIREASGVSWLPVELDVDFSLAVKKGLGDAGADRFFRRLMSAGFETPLLAGFVSGALRLAGRNPMFVMRRVPGGLSLVYRNVGEWTVDEEGPSAARITLAKAPSSIAGSRAYLDTIASSMAAVLELVGRDGEVTLAEHDGEAGRAVFRATWT